MQKKLFSIGFGIGTKNRKGQWLEVFYPKPLLQPSERLVEAVKSIVDYRGGNQVIQLTILQAAELAHKVKSLDEEQSAILVRLAESTRPIVVVLLAEDTELQSTAEAYLKLHLISHRFIKTEQINLSAIDDVLPMVAWTNLGAIDLEEVAEYQLEQRLKDRILSIKAIDKFPPMIDYVIPSGVCITDASMAKLGSYLPEGTVLVPSVVYDINTQR